MKIWLVTSEMPHTISGGIARYVHNFATILHHMGHEVLVLSPCYENKHSSLEADYEIVQFESKYRNLESAPLDSVTEPSDHPAYPHNVMSYYAALAWEFYEVIRSEITKRGAPDIIESQEYLGISYFLLQHRLTGNFLHGERTKLITHIHSPDFLLRKINEDPRFNLPFYWTGRMERFTILAADACLCPSQFVTQQIFQQIEEPTLDLVSIPLPWNDFPSPSPAARNPSQICYVGRIEVRKGVIELLQACENLWNQGNEFVLNLIGGSVFFYPKNCQLDEWLKQKYRKRVESGLLHFHQNRPHHEVMQAISTAGAVVVPSRWENFPNTCIEAMSHGCVVLGSDQGGQAEMIGQDGQAGFLFSWDTPQGIESGLVKILNLDMDARTLIGDRARQRIRRMCAPEHVLPKRIEHFERILNKDTTRSIFPFNNISLNQLDKSINPKPPASGGTLVSVVVPYFNLGQYLPKTLQSIASLTYPDLEIIIVDDGSDDVNSIEVLNSLPHQSNLRILRTSNQGLAKARNYGVEQAKGEFVLLLDADDQVEPEFVNKSLEVFRRYANVGWVYSWVRYFDEGKGFFITWNSEFPFLLVHNMLIPICLVRRSLYLNYGYNKSQMKYGMEDYEGWITMMENGWGGVSIPEVLANYRVRHNSMYHSANDEQRLYLYDIILQNHESLYRKHGDELFNLLNANGPAIHWDSPSSWHSPMYELKNKLIQAQNEKAWQQEQTTHWWKLYQMSEFNLKNTKDSVVWQREQTDKWWKEYNEANGKFLQVQNELEAALAKLSKELNNNRDFSSISQTIREQLEMLGELKSINQVFANSFQEDFLRLQHSQQALIGELANTHVDVRDVKEGQRTTLDQLLGTHEEVKGIRNCQQELNEYLKRSHSELKSSLTDINTQSGNFQRLLQESKNATIQYLKTWKSENSLIYQLQREIDHLTMRRSEDQTFYISQIRRSELEVAAIYSQCMTHLQFIKSLQIQLDWSKSEIQQNSEARIQHLANIALLESSLADSLSRCNETENNCRQLTAQYHQNLNSTSFIFKQLFINMKRKCESIFM